MCIRYLFLGTGFYIHKHVYVRTQSLSRSTAISLESSLAHWSTQLQNSWRSLNSVSPPNLDDGLYFRVLVS